MVESEINPSEPLRTRQSGGSFKAGELAVHDVVVQSIIEFGFLRVEGIRQIGLPYVLHQIQHVGVELSRIFDCYHFCARRGKGLAERVDAFGQHRSGEYDQVILELCPSREVMHVLVIGPCTLVL